MTDLALIALAQAGDSRAADTLLRRYDRRITACTIDYFLATGDRDDLQQEARVGFLKAVRLFNPAIGIPFSSYFVMSVHRWLIWVIRRENARKHLVLSDSYRGVDAEDDSLETAFIETLAELGSDPAEVFERRAQVQALLDGFARLSALEASAVRAYVNGVVYSGAAGRARYGKTLDNALVRARRKLTAELDLLEAA